MSRLNPQKLHVTYKPDVDPDGPLTPRCYTLTHSDRTGDLFLTIGRDVDHVQIGGWYTRLMRDEVLAEWKIGGDSNPVLNVYCHVSGGLVVGSAGWRYAIFQQHLRQVIEAFRYGDRSLVKANPELDRVDVIVHFRARQKQYHKQENWGPLGDYVLLTGNKTTTLSTNQDSA